MSGAWEFIWRHKILSLLGLLVLCVALFMGSRMRGPYHGYELDLVLPAPGQAIAPGILEVGVAKRDISPNFGLYDEWTDVNNNGKYDKDTDTFKDRNGNGTFDAVWMAGFSSNRPAKGIHDPLWARAIALRNNGVTLVMVTIDSVGIFHNDFIAVRKSLDPALKIDHVMLSSLHDHEVPDTMKIWSGPIPVVGYQEHYTAFVRKMAKEAIEDAVQKLAPSEMYCTQTEVPREGFLDDSRKPEIVDDTMYLFRFTKPGTEDTIATLVNWGCHPETLGGGNNLITSDYSHYFREGMERGVPDPNGVEGFGGMCLYFQGQVGGLMTQLHTTVPHRDGTQSFAEASFEKSESLGYNLAIVGCNALRSAEVWKNENPQIAVRAKTIKVKMQGMYKYAIMLGLIHEGYYFGGKSKSEINVLRIGDALLLTVPGEIYPEIVEGGVEALPGRDYEVAPVEVPPLRTAMEDKARIAFVVGLANDQIGYMVPKSQWDAEPPFVYNNKDQYGEENSGGPEVAPTIHRESLALIRDMNETYPPTKTAAQTQ